MHEKTDVNKVLAQLQTLDRDPFQQNLAQLLECSPDEESLRAFSQKYPDKWAKAVQVLASLSGYQEKTENHTNIYTQINVMSDSQLNQELQKVLSEIGKVNVIEAS